MKEPRVTPELAGDYGLSESDFSSVSTVLGRSPTYTELRILAGYWNEACTRKSVKTVSDLLPRLRTAREYGRQTEIPQLIDTGNGMALTLKGASCVLNPGADPERVGYSCSAAAVGDVWATGARPLSLFYSRCVGSMDKRGVRKMLNGLAKGAEAYGLGLGLRTTSAELVSDEGYNSAALFSALVVGVVQHKHLVLPVASGSGNPLFIIGDTAVGPGEESPPDPDVEQSLMKLCLEMSQRSYLVGMRNILSGGIAAACVVMAVNGGWGVTLNLARIPVTGKGMAPSEVLLRDSSGQRVLVVITRGFERELRQVCRNFGLRSAEIGMVNDDGAVRIVRGRKDYGSLPLALFEDGTVTPRYGHNAERPQYLADLGTLDTNTLKQPESYSQVLLELLKTPNVLAKTASVVASRTSGGRQAVLVTEELDTRFVFFVSSSGRYSYLDPRSGGKCAVAAAARQVVCHGASPRGALVGLNFGNLSNEARFYSFREAVQGIVEACRALRVPVVGDHTDCQATEMSPTPVVGMIGSLDDPAGLITPEFKHPGDFILLLGSHRGELGGSEYLTAIHGRREGPPPLADLTAEGRIHEIVIMANKVDLIKSAHPVATGGLAVALSQCLLAAPAAPAAMGARIHMSSKIRDDELLFGETQGLIMATIDEDSLIEIERLCMRMGVPCTAIGRVTEDGRLSFGDFIDVKVEVLRQHHSKHARKLMMG